MYVKDGEETKGGAREAGYETDPGELFISYPVMGNIEEILLPLMNN